jgi:quercetin dioxygenase-like cupin family protein
MMGAAGLSDYLLKVKASFQNNFDEHLPDNLVVSSLSAEWIDPAKISNPSRIKPFLDIPTHSFDISLQEILLSSATDMQRHAHEAVHYVLNGTGYSEIGGRNCTWKTGDFIYTPVWVWHRHYNTGPSDAQLLIIENSKLLDVLGLHQRESAGLIDYATLLRSE